MQNQIKELNRVKLLQLVLVLVISFPAISYSQESSTVTREYMTLDWTEKTIIFPPLLSLKEARRFGWPALLRRSMPTVIRSRVILKHKLMKSFG